MFCSPVVHVIMRSSSSSTMGTMESIDISLLSTNHNKSVKVLPSLSQDSPTFKFKLT